MLFGKDPHDIEPTEFTDGFYALFDRLSEGDRIEIEGKSRWLKVVSNRVRTEDQEIKKRIVCVEDWNDRQWRMRIPYANTTDTEPRLEFKYNGSWNDQMSEIDLVKVYGWSDRIHATITAGSMRGSGGDDRVNPTTPDFDPSAIDGEETLGECPTCDGSVVLEGDAAYRAVCGGCGRWCWIDQWTQWKEL